MTMSRRMPLVAQPLSLLLLSVLLVNTYWTVRANRETERKLRVINEAGFKANIYWINRWKNDELVLNSEDGVFHGSETAINSFIGHEFEIQEVPAKKTGLCRGPNNTCRSAQMKVNENDEQCKCMSRHTRHFRHRDLDLVTEIVVNQTPRQSRQRQ